MTMISERMKGVGLIKDGGEGVTRHVAPLHRVGLTEDVYQRIRAAIFSGELASGERLDIAGLASAFGVSGQPVKEAVNRLALEGLVEIRPRSGTFVRRLTLADMNHLLEARRMIEGFSVRRIVDPDPDALATLVRLADDLSMLAQADPFPYFDYNDHDIRFHETLVGLAGNPEISRLYRSLHSHYVTARAYFASAQEKALASDQDHSAIAALIQGGEYERAAVAAEAHILAAQEGIRKIFGA